ncbi:hypothetical protein PIB30_087778 [Stylosanthes scabra]|uniref:Uncharacterized protein n=1 Tax=Stylosanthes scabra TaxID=79078 RepID=A0ABU6RUG1_9FABA|nr:hypothetical protein [Stylosanthes scabra]
MIGAGKNGPPGKYERWLSSASSGSVGLAMITDRNMNIGSHVWRVTPTYNVGLLPQYASSCNAFMYDAGEPRPSGVVSAVGSLFPHGTKANVTAYGSGRGPSAIVPATNLGFSL